MIVDNQQPTTSHCEIMTSDQLKLGEAKKGMYLWSLYTLGTLGIHSKLVVDCTDFLDPGSMLKHGYIGKNIAWTIVMYWICD